MPEAEAADAAVQAQAVDDVPGPTRPCPRCDGELVRADADATADGFSLPGGRPHRCLFCGWRGWCRSFIPPKRLASKADAPGVTADTGVACSEHPNRMAIGVCAGSGSYICELCRIDLDGVLYGVAYLEAGGKPLVDGAVARECPRPDRILSVHLVISVLSLGCLFFLPIYPIIGTALGVRAVLQHRRLVADDPVYRDLMPRAAGVRLGVLLGLQILVMLLGLTGFFLAVAGGFFNAL